jgi:hypothetical protein
MRLADLDLDTGHLFVRRLKGSLSTLCTIPLACR